MSLRWCEEGSKKRSASQEVAPHARAKGKKDSGPEDVNGKEGKTTIRFRKEARDPASQKMQQRQANHIKTTW